VSKICGKLLFCDKSIDDAKMVERTLSIFSLSNRLLQQQYRWYNYAKYSDLILELLQPENHYNDQNTKIKFWWHEILTEFQGKTKNHLKT